MREFPGVKFGGPIGDVRDPETGLGIGTMVYGDFSVRVTEPEKLVVGLVGLRRHEQRGVPRLVQEPGAQGRRATASPSCW